MSATLLPTDLTVIRDVLGISSDATYINEGNDHPNVKLEVQQLLHRSKLSSLDFALDGKKTIVYFESRKLAITAKWHLQDLVPQTEWRCIMHYHALMSTEYKTKMMEEFQRGRICILLCTEAAGMGCDIPDINWVILFKCPATISSVVQCKGHAACDPARKGVAILLMQPGTVKRPAVKDLLCHMYIQAITCHRAILNQIFNNPMPPFTEDCCDICNLNQPATSSSSKNDKCLATTTTTM